MNSWVYCVFSLGRLMFHIFKIGLILGLSLIISIGAQNLFVIKQGLRRESAYLCAWVCFLCDVILIVLGACGVSAFLLAFPKLKIAILIIGVLFLLYYALTALLNAMKIQTMRENLQKLQSQTQTNQSAKKLILFALSFSILNPQAILDTMVIIGGNASQYAVASKDLFILGTITASFIWFMGLATVTNYFSRVLLNVKFWCGLEIMSGLVMIGFASMFLYKLKYCFM